MALRGRWKLGQISRGQALENPKHILIRSGMKFPRFLPMRLICPSGNLCNRENEFQQDFLALYSTHSWNAAKSPHIEYFLFDGFPIAECFHDIHTASDGIVGVPDEMPPHPESFSPGRRTLTPALNPNRRVIPFSLGRKGMRDRGGFHTQHSHKHPILRFRLLGVHHYASLRK